MKQNNCCFGLSRLFTVNPAILMPVSSCNNSSEIPRSVFKWKLNAALELQKYRVRQSQSFCWVQSSSCCHMLYHGVVGPLMCGSGSSKALTHKLCVGTLGLFTQGVWLLVPLLDVFLSDSRVFYF